MSFVGKKKIWVRPGFWNLTLVATESMKGMTNPSEKCFYDNGGTGDLKFPIGNTCADTSPGGLPYTMGSGSAS